MTLYLAISSYGNLWKVLSFKSLHEKNEDCEMQHWSPEKILCTEHGQMPGTGHGMGVEAVST